MTPLQQAAKFRKKPVVIDAIQWTGNNLTQVIQHTGQNASASHFKWDEYEDLVRRDGLKIFTLEGKMNANIGDWIIKGVKGECYPCKPEIFEITYEAEQAQTVEPCLKFIRRGEPGTSAETISVVAIAALPKDGALLYTAAPPPAKPTVKQPLSNERAELVAWLHEKYHEKSCGEIGLKQAADMLEADAQGVDWQDMYHKQKSEKEAMVAKYEKDIGPLEKVSPANGAQQVAVPARECPYISDPSRVCNKCGQRHGKPTFPQPVAVPAGYVLVDGAVIEYLKTHWHLRTDWETYYYPAMQIEKLRGTQPPQGDQP